VVPKRYTIIVENKTTGVIRRFTLRPWPWLAVLALLFCVPVLFGLAVRWSARAEMQALRDAARTSEVENASYREATADLTGQITALQDTINELSKRSVLDPELAKVIARLPARVRSQATGGTTDGTAVRSALSPALVGPEDTFGILRELLARLETRLQTARSDVEKRSALVAAMPSIWPTHGWLSATFGDREDPFNGGEEFHTGIDLSTDKGAPVVATAAGRVESAAYNGAYGNMIVIDHGFGLKTRYAHLSGFAVRPGDMVERDTVIGFVGATGRATGPHLHYEVLVNGQLVNPFQFLGPRRP
jgi:murein DD-endopeptidase MepM/ murein hydrolase activator NlpD